MERAHAVSGNVAAAGPTLAHHVDALRRLDIAARMGGLQVDSAANHAQMEDDGHAKRLRPLVNGEVVRLIVVAPHADHLQPAVCEILGKWNVLDNFFKHGAKKRAGSLWFDEDANFLMDANVSKLDIAEPYFMFMNHEDISGVFISAAEENQNFSFICPIVSCAHIETKDEESIFEIKSKDKKAWWFGGGADLTPFIEYHSILPTNMKNFKFSSSIIVTEFIGLSSDSFELKVNQCT